MEYYGSQFCLGSGPVEVLTTVTSDTEHKINSCLTFQELSRLNVNSAITQQ